MLCTKKNAEPSTKATDGLWVQKRDAGYGIPFFIKDWKTAIDGEQSLFSARFYVEIRAKRSINCTMFLFKSSDASSD